LINEIINKVKRLLVYTVCLSIYFTTTALAWSALPLDTCCINMQKIVTNITPNYQNLSNKNKSGIKHTNTVAANNYIEMAEVDCCPANCDCCIKNYSSLMATVIFVNLDITHPSHIASRINFISISPDNYISIPETPPPV